MIAVVACVDLRENGCLSPPSQGDQRPEVEPNQTGLIKLATFFFPTRETHSAIRVARPWASLRRDACDCELSSWANREYMRRVVVAAN